MPRLIRYMFLHFIALVFCLANAGVKKAAIVVDFSNNQKIVFSQNEGAKRHPASLTKVMTLYLLFEAVKSGKINFNTKFKVSRLASIQTPSKLGLKVGEKISVLDIIKSLVVKSANDSAVVAAEGLCGSVSNFCELMNRKAKMLGMKNTHFENPSGLPNPHQITTARDIATLGIAIYRHFPQYWYLFSLKSFSYKNAIHGTHSKILHWYKGADGAKTGYIDASGFNLFVTAAKYNRSGDAKRVFVVVMGESSGKIRDRYAAKLMNQYLGEYKIYAAKSSKDSKKLSLLAQVSKSEMLEPIIQETEEIEIAEGAKVSQARKKYFDDLYLRDEDVIQIDEEIFIESNKKHHKKKRRNNYRIRKI